MVTTRQTTQTELTSTSSTSLASGSKMQPETKRRKTNDDSISSQATTFSPSDEKDLENHSEIKSQKKSRKARSLKVDTSHFLPRLASQWKVGAHVSAAGGVENAVINAATIGANAFALFLKSQRKWESPPLSSESIASFKERMKEYGYDKRMVLPHGSYLINLGNPDAEKREKSYTCFLDDLRRCEALELELYNLHPGSTVGQATLENSLALIAESINRAHKETQNVTVVLENMAGAGNVIGSDFSHLAGIIKLVDNKSRVGVCLDTCHAFAAGYDIRTQEGWNATMSEFEEKVGLKYLRGMHLNDSKAALNSKKDRHENLGLGHLGLMSFHHILTDPRTQNIPLVLETPSFEQAKQVWGTEISVLNRLSPRQTAGDNGKCQNKAEDGTVVTDFDVLGKEIKEAVRLGAGLNEKKTTKRMGKATKRKRKEEKEESDDDGDDHECDLD